MHMIYAAKKTQNPPPPPPPPQVFYFIFLISNYSFWDAMHISFLSCALFLQKMEIYHTKVFQSLCLCDNIGNSLNPLN